MRKKKASKRLGWSRHLSLSFLCVPTLFFTLSKNNNTDEEYKE